MKSPKKIFVLFGVAILILSFGLATVSATTDANEKKNTGISLEAKEKKITSLKVSWNANGGKIGSKKTIATSAKKGSKLKKLATTPKRTGYSFQGWYTKKSGGKKVTKNTKITKTNIKETYTDQRYAGRSYKDRVKSNKIDLYKIRINNEGKEQITFCDPSSYRTIDEYLKIGWIAWYTKK